MQTKGITSHYLQARLGDIWQERHRFQIIKKTIQRCGYLSISFKYTFKSGILQEKYSAPEKRHMNLHAKRGSKVATSQVKDVHEARLSGIKHWKRR
jgi:hypothetical protein